MSEQRQDRKDQENWLRVSVLRVVDAQAKGPLVIAAEVFLVLSVLGGRALGLW